MANELTDKLYVIVEEAKKQKFDSAIRLANSIAQKQYEEFSYLRNNKVQYCAWQTIREYINFCKDIKILTADLEVPEGAKYRSLIGFKAWLGDIMLEYLSDNGISVDRLRDGALDLLADRTLPTTEQLFEILNASITEKQFRWSLMVLQAVKPLAMGVCRKWIWIPSDTFKY